MIYHNVIQGTEEWFSLRRGKFTSSNFSDLMMGKTTAGYNKAILKPVYERLVNESPDDFKSAYMERGNEIEPEAVRHYEGLTFEKVHNGGFFEVNEWVGASPDGLIGSDGLLQIKSPAWNTHLGALSGDKTPKEYLIQVQGELMVTGRKWCDLMFFHPKLKEVITRIEADKTIQGEIASEINAGIEKAKSILNKLLV